MNKDKLEDVISEMLEKLETLEPGTDAYTKQVTDLQKLYTLKLEEDKIIEASEQKALDRGLESEKMDHEKEMSKEETKRNLFKIGGDVLKGGLLALANGIWLKQIMRFESTGEAITTKGFQLFNKVKIF